MEQDFGKGGIVREPDGRDYDYAEIGMSLPPFDWNKGYEVENELGITIPFKNQDGSLSCGGQSGSYYGGVLEAINDKSYEERSARFIYSQIFYPNGGTTSRAIGDILVKQGVCTEKAYPSYQDGKPPVEAFMRDVSGITDSVRNDAKLAREQAYSYTKLDIDSVAQAIQANHGAILLIQGSNNGTWCTENPKPPTPNEASWKHFLYAGSAMLVNGAKKIRCLNSWGDVGNKGWQLLGEDYFNTSVFESMTMIFNPNSITEIHHTFDADMQLGDRNGEVEKLQYVLQVNGYFPKTVPCTGYFGHITLQAVKAFQTAEHIQVTGFAGQLTRFALSNL